MLVTWSSNRKEVCADGSHVYGRMNRAAVSASLLRLLQQNLSTCKEDDASLKCPRSDVETMSCLVMRFKENRLEGMLQRRHFEGYAGASSS